jgi:hypothetical protein
LIERYAVDDYPERPAGLAPDDTDTAPGRLSKHETTGPPECLALDLTTLIDAKDLRRSEEAM